MHDGERYTRGLYFSFSLGIKHMVFWLIMFYRASNWMQSKRTSGLYSHAAPWPGRICMKAWTGWSKMQKTDFSCTDIYTYKVHICKGRYGYGTKGHSIELTRNLAVSDYSTTTMLMLRVLCIFDTHKTTYGKLDFRLNPIPQATQGWASRDPTQYLGSHTRKEQPQTNKLPATTTSTNSINHWKGNQLSLNSVQW